MSSKSRVQRGVYSEGLGPSDQKVKTFVSSGPNPEATSRGYELARQAPARARKYRVGVKGGRKWAPSASRARGRPGVIEPKVMVPFETRPGKPPRRVVVERKKRLFARQNIDALLRGVGVDYARFPLDVDQASGAKAYLPLNLFENTEMSVRSPAEWIRLGTDAEGKVAIPAKGLWFDLQQNSRGSFRPCTVTGWDDTKKKFKVTWRKSEQAQKRSEASVKADQAAEDDDTTTLYRIHLCFDSEDPFQFADHVAFAHSARREFEAKIRYSLYVDSMPADGESPLDNEQRQRILQSCLNSRQLKQGGLDIESLLAEIGIDFSRNMNKIIFDSNLRTDGQTELREQLCVPAEAPREEAPLKGTLTIPAYSLANQASEFQFATFYTKGEAIVAMNKVLAECISIQESFFFNTGAKASVKLEEFKQMQTSSVLQRTTELKENWVGRLVVGIKDALRRAGKGSLDINLTNRDMYKFSKVRRFLQLVKFRMEDTVRYLAENSLKKFRDYIVDSCQYSVDIKSTNEVKVGRLDEGDTKGDKDDKDLSLFVVDLEIKDGKIRYDQAVESYTLVPLGLYDLAVDKFRAIPQVEPRIMESIFTSNARSTQLLKTIFRNPKPDLKRQDHKEMVWVQTLYDDIGAALKRATAPMQAYLDTYQKFLDFIALDVDKYIADFAEEPKSRAQITAELDKQLKAIESINADLPDEVSLGVITVRLVNARAELVRKRRQIMMKVQETFCKQTKGKCDELSKEYLKLSNSMKMDVSDVEKLTELKKRMKKVPLATEAKQAELNEAMASFNLLFDYGYRMPKELFAVKWKTYAWPLNLQNQIKAINRKLRSDQANFTRELKQQQARFEEEYVSVVRNVDSFASLTDMSQYQSIAAKAKDVVVKLKEFSDRTRDFNNRERMMKLPLTDYLKVKQLTKRMLPYDDLWATCGAWKAAEKSWYYGPFLKLDPEDVQERHNKFTKTMKKCLKQKHIKTNEGLVTIANSVQTELKAFKPLLPLVENLRHPGMRNRHWKKLSIELDIKLQPDMTVRMTDLTEDFKLHEHITEVTTLGETAMKEYNIEMQLKKMKDTWKGLEFQFNPHEGSNSWILKEVDEVTNLLDEHVVQTQALQFSSFKKVFEEEIQEWNDRLRLCTDVLEQWLILQRAWMGLQPIFASPDIKKQLPREDKKFMSVHKLWRLTMSQVKQAPEVITFCNSESLKDKMSEANNTLEEVQKALAEYLNTKRQAFARFYFLSDDELLSILAKVRDPTNVQPYISKVFENIAKLDFGKKYSIRGMWSAKKELVKFNEVIDPREREVEDWLGEVELMMQETMRYRFKKAIMDYKQRPRNDWVAKVGHPGQCVLQGSQVRWTMEVEEAFDRAGYKGICEYFEALNKQLGDTVALARQKLPKLVRKILGPLIVLDVHAKDVVEDLVKDKCSRKIDFPWIRQMRYYLESKNPTQDNREEKNGQIIVEMTKSRFPMCYEYIGNSGRLVITPLTDRCYMTLMTALQLHLGGAPAGPAGTGKTETVKDLAKACAKFCIVFNCSDGMDYKMTGKFFKGLAMAGAWACFDEFNRINIEVLSVVAQQISSIWNAIRGGLKEFNFEDNMITLDPTCSCFVTMNPGYAGRTELPDNLAALFRPVAMMVPDYAQIAEIMLYSYGFDRAKALSKKMVSTFTLCSEQLSNQCHYDYGMRAVFTVIVRAGLLKGMRPEEDEGILVLCALRDVNVPKFLAHDLPLFEGIIGDLFPGLTKPEEDYGPLMTTMIETTKEMGLQPVDSFLTKCIQLYETTVVRHGLMIVGPTGGGKTSVTRCLSTTLTKLQEMKEYFAVDLKVLNPKSITMGQLYGQNDEVTQEWTDGVLAKIIRRCVEEVDDERKKWVYFDGPVDALWIENMNTVLDDNKKLCLVSGEILSLTPHMRMIFEVEDLEVASPATVSRCGMVYMEPKTLGLAPLVKSYLQTLPKRNELLAPMVPILQKLFDDFLQPAVNFMRKELVEPVPSVDSALAQAVMKIIDSFMAPFMPYVDGAYMLKEEPAQMLNDNIQALFLQAFTWGVGGTTDQQGREKFNKFLRDKIAETKFEWAPPEDQGIYEYSFNLEEGKWEGWMAQEGKFTIKRDLEYSQIVVPTVDSVRYSRLLSMLVDNKSNVLFTGDTGTGKTVNVNSYLSGPLMQENYSPVNIIFSAATTANQVDDFLTEKLEKRRKGVYAPPLGKRFIIFVDDLNMPMREEYFAQPPIEFIRQWMDHGGWYYRPDQRQLPFIQVLDISFIGAMGPPGGGRQPVTPRLLRHFVQIAHTLLVDASKRQIFGTICTSRFDTFSKDVTKNVGKMVESTIEVYNTIARELLPTPEKTHYTFNLRDLSKVFGGMLQANPLKMSTKDQFLRLWIHETRRVFGDRLINETDRKWLDDCMGTIMEKNLERKWEDVMIYERLVFGDFLGGPDNSDSKVYEEAADLKNCRKMIEEYLENYNEDSKAPMALVLFLDAVEHVARISRIIRQPGGNALLLGVGGSGRSSLSRLATYMAEYELFQISITKGYNKEKWHENLKELFMTKALKNIPTVFLYSDTQILMESMLEDVNNILNSGEVPSLIGSEEFEDIYKECKNDCLDKDIEATPLNVYQQFILRVRKNIHIIMCMSPGGETFRTRLRMFPSLVNCCTIDWFSAWPAEALSSVGKQKLDEYSLEFKEVKASSLVEMFKFIHMAVETKSVEYKAKLRRNNYVTPTSYLELLSVYRQLLGEKRADVGNMRDKLQNGLDKLADAEKQVAQLEIDLKAKQPILAKTLAEVKQTSEIVAREKASADVTKVRVEKQANEAKVKADECKAISDDAQKDLDEAIPLLENAVKILKELKESDITVLKSYKKPPKPVVTTMEAMCIMLGKKPAYVKSDDGMKKVKDYWSVAKRDSLANPRKFVQDLIAYDKDNIPSKVIKQVTPYIEDKEGFDPKVIKNASSACEAVCKWVHAMYKYHFVLKEVEPKKQRLAKSQAEFKVVDAALKKVQAELDKILAELAKLEENLDKLQKKKKELNDDVKMCKIKLGRAEKLIGGLGGEKKRWAQTVKKLNAGFKNLAGDVMISAGVVSYLGAFTYEYRKDITDQWRAALKANDIPFTEGCSVTSTLGDPVKIRKWNVCGLPTDEVSIENGIIMDKARRWPLMIDPQEQAGNFIKKLGSTVFEDGLKTVKLTDSNFTRVMENTIRMGRWVLIECVQEELDPLLDPILGKQIFTSGGIKSIKFGDNVLPWSKDFRLYMSSKLPNPHYAPELQVKITLLNFTITPSGLEDQMLNMVVAKEQPELQIKKVNLIKQMAKAKNQLQAIEDKILALLKSSSGNILDDEKLIITLDKSKKTSNEITQQLKEAAVVEKEIDSGRMQYKPVAKRASILYFCIADLAKIDPMYQYSLEWFSKLFDSGIANAQTSPEIAKRLQNLNDYFTLSLYESICRSLFEKHKMLLSLLLTVRIMSGEGKINPDDWRFLVTGAPPKKDMPNPQDGWLQPNVWKDILSMCDLESFDGFEQSFVDAKSAEIMRKYAASDNPYSEKLPEPWETKLTEFQKIIIVKIIRPDTMSLAIQSFVMKQKETGKKFVEPPPFSLPKSFSTSHPQAPIIFVLSPGADPARMLIDFAEQQGMSEKMNAISLGQGQGPKAEKFINEGIKKGTWVLLQNCHLALSWLPRLEKLCEDLRDKDVDPSFRLWLTSLPNPKFPVSVLQNGIKLTNEPPTGLKANMRGSFLSLSDEDLEKCSKKQEYKKLLFALCLFHANALARREYGPLGWNIPYAFTEGDLDVSVTQLCEFLDMYEEIPYKVLNYLTFDINYGGRVTDDKDRRTIMTILAGFMTPEALKDGYKFSESGDYVSPPTGSLEHYHSIIEELPLITRPEAFGMHDNAQITSAQAKTATLFRTILELLPRTAAGKGKSRGELLYEQAEKILSETPKEFDLEQIQKKFPLRLDESMNTVLAQECVRYNRLIKVMVTTLEQLKKALKGYTVMSTELEDMANSLFSNLVPTAWDAVGFESLMPLASWTVDLSMRCKFFQNWYENGTPKVFWISGFFFPQAFLTGAKQNYARKYTKAIDGVSFDFEILEQDASDIKEAPADGCYVRGLFMEGARYDKKEKSIVQSRPKELFTLMPVFWLKPVFERKAPESGVYPCPVYKVLTRAGTLSTTGHSTNFVFWVEIPSKKTPDVWINAGVALFTALKYVVE